MTGEIIGPSGPVGRGARLRLAPRPASPSLGNEADGTVLFFAEG
jgi:hypothetical protein